MALYGDLMTGVTYTLFMPLYLRSFLVTDAGWKGMLGIILLCSGCILHWMAWAKNSRNLSYLAFILQVSIFTTNTIFSWPFGEESMLLPQFLWAVIVHTKENLSLDATAKLAMIAYAFVCSVIATILTESLDTVPTLSLLLTATTFAICLHVKVESCPNRKNELHSARIAGIVLGAVYVYHLATEIIMITRLPSDAQTGGYNIVKMGLVASMCIVATGAFQDQVGSLQRLVRAKGDEMAHQAEIMQMISMALEASETAIAILDAQHSIIWSNSALQQLIGIAPGEMRTLCDAIELSGEALSTFQSCFDISRQVVEELLVNGKEFKLTVSPFKLAAKSSSTFSDVSGTNEVRFLVSLSDISQICAIERAERAAEQAAIQRTAMQESMETLTHELRTPLQGIIGMTSLVFESSHLISPEEMFLCLNTVMASSRLLLTLINNLLDCHKMDANMMDDFWLSPVPLAAAMRDTMNYCRPIAALNDSSPQLCLDYDESENIVVRSNPVRFQQVLVNLVSNAIKYAGHGLITLRGEVVSVDEANDMIRHALARGCILQEVNSPTSRMAIISVEDSGDGIPLEMISRVFQKFSQYSGSDEPSSLSTHASAHPSGTGIGLNLCRKFVERMGGNIWVINRPSGGARFSFCLPVVDASAVELPTEASSTDTMMRSPSGPEPLDKQAVSPRHISGQALKILIVDDTMINLKVLERMIKRISNEYTVVTADTGTKALDVMRRIAFDLVITDPQMPHMSGFELSQAIQTSPAIHPKPIIVALTAETSESLHQRCSAAGISHILYKPISCQQFMTFFDKTLRSLSS